LAIGNRQLAIRKGFTLLEVILAVGLVVLLMSAVFAFYQNMLSARQRTLDEGQSIFAQRKVLEFMADELQASFTSPSAKASMLGQLSTTGESAVTFQRAGMPAKSVYYAVSVVDAPSAAGGAAAGDFTTPQQDVQQVSYRLRHYLDDSGADQIAGLERSGMAAPPANATDAVSTEELTLLSESVKFLYVEYWDGTAWQTSWSGDALPSALRVTLGTDPLPADATADTYPGPTVWRIISLPAGVVVAPPDELDTGAAFTGGNVFSGGNVNSGGNVFSGGNVNGGSAAGGGTAPGGSSATGGSPMFQRGAGGGGSSAGATGASGGGSGGASGGSGGGNVFNGGNVNSGGSVFQGGNVNGGGSVDTGGAVNPGSGGATGGGRSGGAVGGATGGGRSGGGAGGAAGGAMGGGRAGGTGGRTKTGS
jgi:prepilin-type N-terminal cleavage/methylation domain-containing protein